MVYDRAGSPFHRCGADRIQSLPYRILGRKGMEQDTTIQIKEIYGYDSYRQSRAAILILSTVIITFLFSSCGLPTVTYLYPPEDLTVNEGILTVKNNSNNYDDSEASSQTYRGIEIYYRVYTSDPTAIITTLNTLAATYKDEPESFLSLTTGTTYKFSRLRIKDTSAAPLISIDAADESAFSIYFDKKALSDDWRLTDENSNLICYVTRTLDSNANISSLSFPDKDFNSGDFDFSGSTISSSDIDVFIVFFAVSFGVDQNSTVGQTVYSAPYIASSYATY